MSSSSSLSGARRRRAGGGSGPTSTSNQGPKPIQNQVQRIPPGMKGPPPQRIPPGMKGPAPPQPMIVSNPPVNPSQPDNSPVNPSQPDNSPINPIQILQQHELKISSMENVLREIMSNKNDNKNDSKSDTVPNIDINTISENILGNLEEKLDLKSFYENDEKLITEIEMLKNTLQSQQMIINGLNHTLYSIVSQLKLSSPIESVNNDITQDTNMDLNEDVTYETNEDVTYETNDNKSVFINEDNNMTLEIDSRDYKFDYNLDNPTLD